MHAVIRPAILLLLLAALWTLAGRPATAADLLSEEHFTDAYLRVLTDKAQDFTVRRTGPLHLTAKDATGKEVQAFLDNAYNTYRNNPEALDDILQRYATSAVETWRHKDAIDLARIVPVVKDAAYVPDIQAQMRRLGTDPGWRPASETYNEALVILYAEDTDVNIRYMSETELVKTDFPTKGRLPRAMANLKALLPKLQVYDQEGFYWVTAGGDYDASLLLFDRLWESLNLPLKGEIVAAIPARNALVITGSEDREGLAALKRFVAETVAGDSYPLTDQLFVYRNGRFELFGS